MSAGENAKEAARDYKSALADLHINSKPLITFLTMLADENKNHSSAVTQVIITHIKGTVYKLPAMYLIDSIVKNVGDEYKRLFGSAIANIFTGVFKEVDEKTRKKLYELRQTWNEVFPKSRLFQLDTSVHEIDPAWPITSQPRIVPQSSTIHVNPNKFKPHTLKPGVTLPSVITKLPNMSTTSEAGKPSMANTQDIQELQKLQTEKRVLEETRKKVEKLMKENETPESSSKMTPNIHIAPWKAKQILPSMTAPTSIPSLKDIRGTSVASRDPRLAHGDKKESKPQSHDPLKQQKDPRSMATPRESGPSQRDPRLANKSTVTPPVTLTKPSSSSSPIHPTPVSINISTSTSTTTTVNTYTSNSVKIPRIVQNDGKKVEKLKDKDPPNKTKKDKEKDRETTKTKDSSDSKRGRDKSKYKEKERSKSRDKEKEKKKPELSESFHDKEKEETKVKLKKETKNKKEVKDKPKVDKSPPKELLKNTEENATKGGKFKGDQLECPTSDKFRAKNDASGRTKLREHIRPRIESPEEEVKIDKEKQPVIDISKPQSTNENTGESVPVVLGSTKKRPCGKDSDSEDSDHYDANKPQPSLYANKKDQQTAMKIPETANPEVKAYTLLQAKTDTDSSNLPVSSTSKHSFESQVIDTDMRQLSSQPDIIPPPIQQTDEIVEIPSNTAQCLDLDLFGKEDVDLRQLAIPSHFPAIPTNLAGSILPLLGKPDEDMRIVSDLRKTLAFGETPSSRVTKAVESDRPEFLKTPQREEVLLSDSGAKKSFNSPHAAKWEKFREKNPEFKEYERQASSTDKMEIEGEIINLDDDSHMPRGSRSFGRSHRNKDYRRPLREENIDSLRDRERRSASPLESQPGDENYQYMISQLSDQFRRGEISRSEYGRCLEDIRLMVEQGKIRELQAKEGRWSPRMRHRGYRGPGPWSREFPSGPAPVGDKYHANKGEEKWPDTGGNRQMGPSWHQRGGGNGHAPPRGFHPNYQAGPGGSHHPRFDDDWTGDPSLPSITEDVLRTVFRESETRTIDIDSKPREIRTYGERAVILMDWNEPHRISFEPVQCDIVFDNGELVLPMHAGENHREFLIDGETHRVKLGVPTQELLIDGKGYQCFFGGKPITVHLAGKNRTVSLTGKPPKVNISQVRNSEYLLGKIELIINAKKIIPLYLDAKPQRFNIDGIPFVIKFIDSFLAVTINGVRFPVIFGGLPITISVRGFRRFLRFSNLPPGVIPGQTTVKGMDSDGNTLVPVYPPSPPPPMDSSMVPQFNPSGIRAPGGMPPISHNTPVTFPNPTSTGFSQNPMPTFSPAQDAMKMPLGVVSIRPPAGVGIVPGSYLTTAEGTGPSPPGAKTPLPVPPLAPVTTSTPAITSAQSSSPHPVVASSHSIDVQELLDRLVKTGIIGEGVQKDTKKDGTKDGKEEKKESKAEEEEEELDDLKDLPPIEVMFNVDHLKKRNPKLIKRLYRGMQCSSCGLRYPPEQTQQYSHHLDWHFRMNKKQQESTKKVNTRKFYLCFEDWIQYEEIEDLEERVPSMFEVEGQLNTKTLENEEEDGEEEIPSIAVASDPSLGVCPICHETFDQFYHQNTEEWHYKYAIQGDGINYHPACHQDFIKIQKQEEEKLKKDAEEKEHQENITVELKPDDDDDVEEVKVEDEEIQEIEKEVDTKPKEEIDLTTEDDKMEESEEPEDPSKQKQKKVTEALEKMRLLSNGLPPSYRIKEEQMDVEDEMNVIVNKGPPLLADIPVKVEIEEPEIEELPSYDIDDDDVTESDCGETPNTPWIAPAHSNTAQTDTASSIDGNTELVINTETSEAPATVPKIKISVSIPTQNNIEGQLNANNNSSSLPNSEGEETESTEIQIEKFIPPPFTVNLELKPAFRGVCLLDQPVAHRGVEVSSLCSVM